MACMAVCLSGGRAYSAASSYYVAPNGSDLAQGSAATPFRTLQYAVSVLQPGDTLTVRAADHQDGPSDTLEVLLLGGLPIREPIAHYGPFVMNTREEILQAVDDFNAGRMGTIPAVDLS